MMPPLQSARNEDNDLLEAECPAKPLSLAPPGGQLLRGVRGCERRSGHVNKMQITSHQAFPVGLWTPCDGSVSPESCTDLFVRSISLRLRLCPGAVGGGEPWKGLGHPTPVSYYLTAPLGYVQLPHLAAFLAGLSCSPGHPPGAGRAWRTEDSQYLLDKRLHGGQVEGGTIRGTFRAGKKRDAVEATR